MSLFFLFPLSPLPVAPVLGAKSAGYGVKSASNFLQTLNGMALF